MKYIFSIMFFNLFIVCEILKVIFIFLVIFFGYFSYIFRDFLICYVFIDNWEKGIILGIMRWVVLFIKYRNCINLCFFGYFDSCVI